MDFFKCVSNPVSAVYHAKLPHSLLPGLNLQKTTCEKHFDEHNESFPFKCTSKQVFKSPCIPKRVQEGQDPVSQLVIAKTQWKTKSELLVHRFRKSAEARVKLEAFRGRVLCGVDEIVVPRNDQRLLKHFKNDPDPYFDGVYNWYYCGGSLSTAIYEDKNYTISAQGRYLDELCIVPLIKENDSLERNSSIIKTKSNEKQPIYQIKSVVIAGRVAVGVRQRDAIHLYLENCKNDSLTLKKKIKILADNGKPFTGLDLNPSSLGQLCSSTCDRKIKLWDLNQQSYVLAGEVTPNSVCPSKEKRENGWCGVTFRSEFEIFVTDKCCFTWIDTRCDLKKPVKGFCLKVEGKKFLDLSCEEISCLLYTKQRNIYIGSTHSVMQYEPRNSFSVPVRSWNHQLSSPPFLAQSSNLGNMKELLCIGDHKQIVCIIAGKICCSSYPPLTLPSVSKPQGIMGLTEFPEYFRDETGFLMQTSAGHIYKQIFKSGRNGVMDNEPPPNEIFCKKRLYASSWKNMEHIYKYLKKKVDSPEVVEGKSHPHLPQKWQISKEELESSVDLLSPVILQAWEIEDMEEWSRDGGRPLSPSGIDKVEQWLKNTSFTRHSIADSPEANKKLNKESHSSKKKLSINSSPSFTRHSISDSPEANKKLNKESHSSKKKLSINSSPDMFESQQSQGSTFPEHNKNSETTRKRFMGSLERNSKRIKLSARDGLYKSYDLTLQSTQETEDNFCYLNQDCSLEQTVDDIVLSQVTKKKKNVHLSGF